MEPVFIPDASRHAKIGYLPNEEVMTRPLYFSQAAVRFVEGAGDQKVGYTETYPLPHLIRGAKAFGYRTDFPRRDAFLSRLQVEDTADYINVDFLPCNLLAGEFSDEYSPAITGWRPGKAISYFPFSPGVRLLPGQRIKHEVINRTLSPTTFAMYFAAERLDRETRVRIPSNTRFLDLVIPWTQGVTTNVTTVVTQRYSQDLLILGGFTSFPDNPYLDGTVNTDPEQQTTMRITDSKNGESWSLDFLPSACFFAPMDAQETVLKYPVPYLLKAGSTLEIDVNNPAVTGNQYIGFMCQTL
jgi:hypothetical protein